MPFGKLFIQLFKSIESSRNCFLWLLMEFYMSSFDFYCHWLHQTPGEKKKTLLTEVREEKATLREQTFHKEGIGRKKGGPIHFSQGSIIFLCEYTYRAQLFMQTFTLRSMVVQWVGCVIALPWSQQATLLY